MKFTIHYKILLLCLLNLCISCDSEDGPEEPQLPEIVTVTNETEAVVTPTSVEITGTISESDANLSSYGVVWGKNPNPTLEDNVIPAGDASAKAAQQRKIAQQAQNTFTVKVDGLIPGEIYYFKTYATNEAGTVYGEEIGIGTQSMAGTKWEITFHHEEDTSWIGHVTFHEDGTAFYTEPDYPGEFDFWGVWSMDENYLTYDMLPDDEGESYVLTGKLNENEAAGTYTYGTPDDMTHRPWTGVLLSSEVD